jgi:hypothetical protein
MVLVLAGILASARASSAGELRGYYGSPQLREIWHNDATIERKMTVQVSAVGGAICTISASGGTTRKYDSDKGRSDDIVVPPGGTISLTAGDSGVPPKPVKGAAPGGSSPTCSYSVTESRELSK